ncbi:MAG TPA: BLUF domain-containing protein [Gemmatimonadaceae bacterium]|nr:BLUF domain-containing protein [Gemmatimonadaceae bacterium]
MSEPAEDRRIVLPPRPSHGRMPSFLSLTYQSRATREMSVEELHALQRAAVARNHAEDVTGMLLYAERRFFQWIEGPPRSIERIWNSISRDSRHTDITSLAVHSSTFRLFGQWNLKLAKKERAVPTDHASRQDIHWPASRLAYLVATGGEAAAAELMRTAADGEPSRDRLADALIEPAARRLGDLWMEDACTETDLFEGLWRLQTLFRSLPQEPRPESFGTLSVLIAPIPGEPHQLSAALAAEAVWQAGWSPRVHFPADTDALLRLVASEPFDAVDLTLSASLQRSHRLAAVAELADDIRQASLNPGIVVVVGGRVFHDLGLTGDDVNADAVYGNANGVIAAIRHALAHRQGA